VINTYALLDGAMAYLKSAMPGNLELIEVANDIDLWQIGYSDPTRLPAYDAVLLVPDRADPNDADRTVVVPCDVFVVAAAADVSEAYRKELAYIDALMEAVRNDRTMNGRFIDSTVGEVDYFDPVSGASTRVIARCILDLEYDTLVE
jgi:hypothetical protein